MCKIKQYFWNQDILELECVCCGKPQMIHDIDVDRYERLCAGSFSEVVVGFVCRHKGSMLQKALVTGICIECQEAINSSKKVKVAVNLGGEVLEVEVNRGTHNRTIAVELVKKYNLNKINRALVEQKLGLK